MFERLAFYNFSAKQLFNSVLAQFRYAHRLSQADCANLIGHSRLGDYFLCSSVLCCFEITHADIVSLLSLTISFLTNITELRHGHVVKVRWCLPRRAYHRVRGSLLRGAPGRAEILAPSDASHPKRRCSTFAVATHYPVNSGEGARNQVELNILRQLFCQSFGRSIAPGRAECFRKRHFTGGF